MTDKTICSIDVGTSKIAAIIAKIGEDSKEPRIMGFSSAPSKGVKKGQIVDINQVTNVIEEAVEKAERMAGIKMQNSYVCVGGPHIESINSQGVVAVTRPEVEISNEDIDRVVEAARAISLSSTREVIEVIPREYIVDGQAGIKNPLGMNGVRLEVDTHIITAGVTNLKNIERSLSDLGIGLSDFVFSGLASALATLTETEKELGVVSIDIGGGKIDVSIYVEGALSYSRSIPIGARHITNDIAVGLRVSLDSAESIKLYLSKEEKNHKNKIKKDEVDITSLHLVEELKEISYKTVVDGIMRPRLEEMFEEIFKVLDDSEFSTLVPSGLVITGGGALTVGLLDTARRVVGMPARIGKPGYISGLADEVVFPQYSTAVGLLLCGSEDVESPSRLNIKDFDKIFRNFSVNKSIKSVNDFIKTLIPK